MNFSAIFAQGMNFSALSEPVSGPLVFAQGIVFLNRLWYFRLGYIFPHFSGSQGILFENKVCSLRLRVKFGGPQPPVLRSRRVPPPSPGRAYNQWHFLAWLSLRNCSIPIIEGRKYVIKNRWNLCPLFLWVIVTVFLRKMVVKCLPNYAPSNTLATSKLFSKDAN